MEAQVVDILKKVGCPEADAVLEKGVIKDGPKSVEYTRLVEWLSKELSGLCSLDDHVNAISSQEDSSAFLLELSGFLKEIGCQYKSLTEGHVNERLQSVTDRLLLLDYLATELAAAKIMATKSPESNKMCITLNESSTGKDLSNILSALSMPVPDDLIVEKLFLNMEKKVEEILESAPKSVINKPLFTGDISNEQWESLTELVSELEAEYKIRREMLLKRLDVTIQSFMWSERMVGKEDKIASVYYPKRQRLSAEPSVDLADILAAREDLAVIEKTSSINVRKRTRSSINKVVIGQVPDRGGRPNEQQPPPPEMPSWTQRSSGGFGGGRGGFGGRGRGGGDRGGGGRGGRGGWNRDNRDRDDRHSEHDDRHKGRNNDRGYYVSERDRHHRR